MSRRQPRATDFRVVQGAINSEAICGLLSGLAGTIASSLYPYSISGVSITGMAAKAVGVCADLILIGVALSPKALALLLSIPAPVAAAYMVALFSLIFMQGVRSVTQHGLDARKSVIAGVGLWIGVSFDSGWIFPGLILEGTWGTLLGSGLTTGSLVAIVLTLILEFTSHRPRRLNVNFDRSAFVDIDVFLHEFASNAGWNEGAVSRLRLAGEETLSSLLTQRGEGGFEGGQRLTVNACRVNGSIEMEFLASEEGEESLEDRLAYLSEQFEVRDDREISFRLLRHYASSVQHRKYHGMEIITVQVEGTS